MFNVSANPIPGHRDEKYADSYTPNRMMENVVSVSSYMWITRAITTDGSLWTFGNNGGSYGSPDRIMENVAAISGEGFFGLISGTTGLGTHTLLLLPDGSLWAWGSNDFGQLGDGTTERRREPVLVMESVMMPHGMVAGEPLPPPEFIPIPEEATRNWFQRFIDWLVGLWRSIFTR